MPAPFPSEDILPDHDLVDVGEFFVCDGKVVRSEVCGDVRDLKHATGAREVRCCDLVARAKALSPESAEGA